MKSKFKYGEMFSNLKKNCMSFTKWEYCKIIFVLGGKILHKEKDWLW